MSTSPVYDKIIFTHFPSFYKINLFNKVSQNCKIIVIFLSKQSSNRSSDFYSTDILFDHLFISENNIEEISFSPYIFKIFRILNKYQYNKILISGWDYPHYWLINLISYLKNKSLSLILESNIYDSRHSGFNGFLKKVFLLNVDLVYASGSLHSNLLHRLFYNGKIVITGGVGLINTSKFNKFRPKQNYQILFIGRNSPEKNIEKIIYIFSQHLKNVNLLLAGFCKPKNVKNHSNIKYIGYVSNEELYTVFSTVDALILPSLKEPWGLVVDEALYNNVPVLLSQNCGSVDLIQPHKNGLLFDPNSTTEIISSVKNFYLNYYNFFIPLHYRQRVLSFIETQVEAFSEN